MITCHIQHFLYRYFDRSRNLLYVGVTMAPKERDSAHRFASHWYKDATSMQRVACSSWGDALNKEAAAIMLEKPKFNVRLNKTRAADVLRVRFSREMNRPSAIRPELAE